MGNDKVYVFDTETTGFDEARIIEAAWLKLLDHDDLLVVQEYCERFDPLKPISFGAMAVHNILQSEVTGLPSYATFALPSDVTYLIGHNVDFDWKVIGSPTKNAQGHDIRLIDTLALSRKYCSSVDSHSQGAMMYHFFGESAREYVKGAHSALDDVEMCRRLLSQLIALCGSHSWEQLWELSEEARIPEKMTFGKHDKERIVDLPKSYVSWLRGQSWYPIEHPYLKIAIDRAFK